MWASRQANPGARYDTKVPGVVTLEGKGGVCGKSNGGVFFFFSLLVSGATTSPAVRFVCYEIDVSQWSLMVLTL